MMFITSVVLTTALVATASAAHQTGKCLHEPGRETTEQQQRRHAAIGAARAINSLEAKYAAANARTYANTEALQDLAKSEGAGQISYTLDPKRDIVPGFKLKLDAFESGYWFEIKDTMDPCGFRIISNQEGVIFDAQPLK